MSVLREWFCACGFKGTFKGWAIHLDDCPYAVPLPTTEPDIDWKARALAAEATVARVKAMIDLWLRPQPTSEWLASAQAAGLAVAADLTKADE